MSTISFESLTKSTLVMEYLAAFTSTTGVRLRLGPVGGQPSILCLDQTVLTRPVVIGGENVAILLTDPFFCGDRSRFERTVRRHKRSGGKGELDRLVVISEAQHRGMKDLLRIFAKDIGFNISRELVGQRDQDPPCVLCARQFIHAHSDDPLTLFAVATHVHLCADQISRRFKIATGLTIAQYIARVRTEKVKEAIAGSGIGFAEAAFASGFQSIPSFNRQFKTYVGKSPTEYRRSMRAVAGGRQRSTVSPRKQRKTV